MTLSALAAECKRWGFSLFGVIDTQDHRDNSPCQIVLVGHYGDAFWTKFVRSPEFHDALPDKLDRYSIRNLSSITPAGAELIAPNARPYPPLQKWAKMTGNMHQSPMGLLIHARYGLWFAFRAAWRFPAGTFPIHIIACEPSPCESCATQPCLSTCPVSAFRPEGFAALSCRDYLDQPNNPCSRHQCLARLSCPVGTQYHYNTDTGRFFLEQFHHSTTIA